MGIHAALQLMIDRPYGQIPFEIPNYGQDLAAGLRRRELSYVEVMDAHLAQIARVNPQVNAIVTLVAEQARPAAAAADTALARGDDVGPLHGLPVAHKDLVLTRNIRTTFGSRVLEHFVPDQDALLVERLRSPAAWCRLRTAETLAGRGRTRKTRLSGEEA